MNEISRIMYRNDSNRPRRSQIKETEKEFEFPSYTLSYNEKGHRQMYQWSLQPFDDNTALEKSKERVSEISKVGCSVIHKLLAGR